MTRNIDILANGAGFAFLPHLRQKDITSLGTIRAGSGIVNLSHRVVSKTITSMQLNTPDPQRPS